MKKCQPREQRLKRRVNDRETGRVLCIERTEKNSATLTTDSQNAKMGGDAVRTGSNRIPRPNLGNRRRELVSASWTTRY